jgi:anti-sigma regulatory factor (Ser/Thr protein kinase)
MSKPIELTLLNRPTEIARLQDLLEMLARQHGYPAKTLHEIQLAVEELLTNILNYAFPDQREHEIRVCLRPDESGFEIEVADDGRPFNPLEHPAPDLSLPLEQRPVGGLGIHMIRKSMDRIVYRRADGKNILVMAKQIKSPTP